MCKDVSNISNEIVAINKELFSKITDITTAKEIQLLKISVSKIEEKLSRIDETLEKVFEMLNNITIFIEEAEDSEEELDDEEDWTPYDERNFHYHDDEENDDIEDFWNNHEDES
jgi:hypothetical protein